MAVVGRADIIVRAITTGVADDIRRGFDGVEREVARSGTRAGNKFSAALSRSFDRTKMGKFAQELRDIAPGGEDAAEAFTKLVRKGYFLQSALGAIGGSIGAVIGGLGALIGVAGGAAASVVALGGVIASVAAGMSTLKFGLGGIGEALQDTGGGGGAVDRTNQALRNLALTVERNAESLANANNRVRSAQIGLNNAYQEGAEYLQQLGFEAEDAALSQERASMSLEEARENLARVQDLPPNSRARREAELAFREADLNYRQATDRANDLAVEQDRYAQEGVDATDAVIQAKQELLEAEEDLARTVRDNLRAQIEAEEALAEARKSGAAGGQSAYDKLTKTQKTFVDYLKREVIPQFKNLREEVASGFIPELIDQLKRLDRAGAFDVVIEGLAKVGDSLGVAIENFTDQLINSGAIGNLESFFDTASKVLPRFGSTLGAIFGSVLTLLRAAEPITLRFAQFLESKAVNFSNFLKLKDATGELEAFFTRSGELAARFGGVFGGLFNGFGDIIAANFAPGSGGDILLTWLEDVADGFANMNKVFLENYFRQAAKNAIALGDSLGILVEILTKAGGSPEIETFYRTLNTGAFYLQKLVQESVKASVPLAGLINSLTKIGAVLGDSGATIAFLETIGLIFDGFAAVLKVLEPILAPLGVFLAMMSALALTLSVVNKIKTIFIGLLTKGIVQVGRMGIAVKTMEGALTKMGVATAATTKAMAAGLGPVGWAIMAIEAALLAVVVVAGILEDQYQKRMAKVAAAFEAGASAVDTFNAALGASKENPVFTPKDLNLAKNYTKELVKVAKAYNTTTDEAASLMRTNELYDIDWMNQGQQALNEFRGTVDEVGGALANLATTDIRGAQEAFSRMYDGMDPEQLLVAIQDIDTFGTEFVDAMTQAAAAEGIAIDANGDHAAQIQFLEYAFGDGEVAAKRYYEGLVEGANQLGQIASKYIDIEEAVKGATEAEKINWDNARERLQAQLDAAAAYARNRTLLQTQFGFSEEEIAAMEEMGLEQAQAFAQGIVDGSITGVSQWQDLLGEAAGNANEGLLSEIEANEMAYQEAYARWGKAAADQMMLDIENGSADVMAVLKLLGIDISELDPTFTVDTDLSAVSYIPKAVRDAIKLANDQANAVVIRVNATRTGSKNGGLIGGLNMQGFANGGMVTGGGYGGGRSDRIPAMLSNGEYVVNAMATAKNLSLLNKLNYGGQEASTGPNVNITVNPAPGMDERELASVVSQELMRQMRRGSI